MYFTALLFWISVVKPSKFCSGRYPYSMVKMPPSVTAIWGWPPPPLCLVDVGWCLADNKCLFGFEKSGLYASVKGTLCIECHLYLQKPDGSFRGEGRGRGFILPMYRRSKGLTAAIELYQLLP